MVLISKYGIGKERKCLRSLVSVSNFQSIEVSTDDRRDGTF